MPQPLPTQPPRSPESSPATHPAWRCVGALTLVAVAWCCVAIIVIDRRALWVIAVATIAVAWTYQLALEEHRHHHRG